MMKYINENPEMWGIQPIDELVQSITLSQLDSETMTYDHLDNKKLMDFMKFILPIHVEDQMFLSYAQETMLHKVDGRPSLKVMQIYSEIFDRSRNISSYLTVREEFGRRVLSGSKDGAKLLWEGLSLRESHFRKKEVKQIWGGQYFTYRLFRHFDPQWTEFIAKQVKSTNTELKDIANLLFSYSGNTRELGYIQSQPEVIQAAVKQAYKLMKKADVSVALKHGDLILRYISTMQFKNGDVDKILALQGQLLSEQKRPDMRQVSTYIFFCAMLDGILANQSTIELLSGKYLRTLNLDNPKDQHELIRTAKQLCIGGWYDNQLVQSLNHIQKGIDTIDDRALLRIYEVKQMASVLGDVEFELAPNLEAKMAEALDRLN